MKNQPTNKPASECMEIILQTIENGTLPPRETEDRLNMLIEREIDRKDAPASMELISAAQMLLWELHTHGSMPFENHSDSIRRKVSVRYSAWKRLLRALRITTNLAIACGVIVLGVVIASKPIKLQWIEGESINGGEQYRLQGASVVFDLNDAAHADVPDPPEKGIVINVTSHGEYVQHLGYDPTVPECFGEWQFDHGYISRDEDKDSITAHYRAPDGTKVFTTFWNYSNHAKGQEQRDMYSSFRQHEAGGETFAICSDNEDFSSVAWCSEKYIYTFSSYEPFDRLTEAAVLFREQVQQP